MLDIYQTLEIKSVLEEIYSYSKSEIAKEMISSLRMFPNIEDVQKQNALVDEMMSILLRHGPLPISTSFNLDKYVETISKGGVLTPLEFDHIASDIENANNVLYYFGKAEKHLYVNLNQISNRLVDLTPLHTKIRNIILPNLNIRDDASKTLLTIRNNIKKVDNEVRSLANSLIVKYKDHLSEEVVTIRDGHFVLPIKASSKNKVPGIIHDFSDSGLTVFIEPSSLVELSNKIQSLKADEKEEIYRLLYELSQVVALSKDNVRSNNLILSELDYISAKATYGNNHNCFVAKTINEKIISIKGARHPLIKSDQVVANDFELNEKQRIIIISGPNAGGKTVALKTLGLMVMMNQMGIPLTTSTTAELGYFPRIYADIGDNQSLSDNLSTFAAHVSNLSTITHFVTSKDLVLLDELGTGTSPLEGESLAISVTDFLLKKHTFSLISSHFEAMKEYAYKKDNVVNAMMVFSEAKLLPTYILKVGVPGRSYGLEMAKRYHLNEEVVVSAKNYLSKNKKSDINDVLTKLNNVLEENERLNKTIKEKERIISGKEKDLQNKEEELLKRKSSLLEDVANQKDEMVEQAKKKINEVLKILNDPNAKAHQLIEAKKQLEEISKNDEDVEFVEVDNEPIKINDYVEVSSIGLLGRVTKINGNKVEVITSDGMNVKSTKDNLVHRHAPTSRSVRKTNVDELLNLKTNTKLELNIIGFHIDEGIEAVSKYLDDCRLRNFESVRIIHGMGSGALRKAVHEYLKTQSFVKEFHFGGQYDGGTGATIVKLK